MAASPADAVYGDGSQKAVDSGEERLGGEIGRRAGLKIWLLSKPALSESLAG
jgi:hypothetical protein